MWQVFAHAPFGDLWQPPIIIAAIVMQVGYLLFTRGPIATRLYGSVHIVTTQQSASFIVGCWVMYFSFAGPLDYLSDNYIFGAHMVQHMVEITIMTPLILKGLPSSVFFRLLHLRGVSRVIKFWANPIVAGAVFNVVLTTFHSPYLYNLALVSDNFHLFEHIVFFIIASFMWAPLLISIPGRSSLTNGKKLLYLLYNYNLMMPIVVLLFMARHPWYSFYVHAPRLVAWLTPLADMQLGAVVMMVFMAGAYLIYGIRIFAKHDESIWYA